MTLAQELLDRAVLIDRDNLIWDVLKGGDRIVQLFLANGTLELPSNRKEGRNERESILLDAARKGQIRLVKRLVDRHFKISVQKSPELLASLASIACGAGPRGAMTDETFSTLLSHSVDINASDGAYHTALTRAILFHGTKCVKYILMKGADPLCENSDPLLCAAQSSLEKLETLLQAIEIYIVSAQELRERITGCQHSSAWDQKMGAVKVFERFLVKVNAEFGSV